MAQERDQGMSTPASNGDAPAPSAETADIRTQIEQTRTEMSRTIDAIQERLSPSRIVAEAADTAKEAASKGVMSVIRGPIPIALASAATTAVIVMTMNRSRARTTSLRASGSYVTQIQRLLALAGAGMACWRAWQAYQRALEGPGAPPPTTWPEREPVIDEPF